MNFVTMKDPIPPDVLQAAQTPGVIVPMPAPRNIYQRINEVRRKISYVRKDKEVETGGKPYKAVTHDAVTAFVRDALIELGVIIVPTLVQSRIAEAGVTSKGTPIIRYEATYAVAWVNEDDPKDRVTIDVEAHANDSGDKAPGKALSYAVKYSMLKMLNLETGEDEESRMEILKRAQDLDASLTPWIQKMKDAGSLGALQKVWEEMPPVLRNKVAFEKDAAKLRITEANKKAAEEGA